MRRFLKQLTHNPYDAGLLADVVLAILAIGLLAAVLIATKGGA